MAESTVLVECNPSMDIPSEPAQATVQSADGYVNDTNQNLCPTSPMEDIKQEDMAMNMSMAMSSPVPSSSAPMGPKRSTPLKGSKSSSMLRSVTAPHPLSMSTGHSLQHFQSAGNTLYSSSQNSAGFNSNGGTSNNSSTNSIFSPNTPIGPLSAPSSPSFPNSTTPGSATPSSFVAMHGHNTSLYEPFRRNSVPILTADQAEHKRKVSEEKHMQRQGSWSSLSSSSSMMGGAMNGVLGVPPPVLHHLDASHLDPATMHYYRTQFSQQHMLQQHMQQHALNQVMPSANSSNCPSPMPESFMSSTSLNGSGQSGSGPVQHSTTGAIRGNSTKVKRNNSICSTTSISSTGSGSNNKHPCKYPSCEWSFKRYEHLKRHMLVHTKERPFQCDFTGCNKSFSRSDNFSAHLRTHSKKALAHRRYDSRGLDGSGNSGMNIKQESQESQQGSSVSGDQHSSGGMVGFMPHSSLHLSNSYSSNSMGQDASDYGSREYSPPVSPGGTPMGRSSSALGTSSSMNDDDFDMMGHSSYPFGNSSMYSLDHLDQLSTIAPRLSTIRLDLKSVAPSDIHKQYGEESNSDILVSSSNPNGESPCASPMHQYDHFSFPSSISTHFMPTMPSGFSTEQQQQQQPQQQNALGQQMSHESLAPNPYSSLQSTDSFHHHQGYHSDTDLKNLQFSHGINNADSDVHYSPSPPSNEDSSHLHHPQPYHHASYESKVANPQMFHHATYSGLPMSTSAALPPHPLMSSMSSSPVPGLNESLSGSQVKAHQRSVPKFQLKQQRQAQTA
ncbi:hypothetical protein BGZ58_007097 [Dissophora ornata]|nr:hypothetical protein BGZ58_007097 [Dissophora ornata]